VRLTLLLLMAVAAFGQAFTYTIPPAPAYKLPQYLLVTRSYSPIVSVNTGTVEVSGVTYGGWSYSYQTYDSLEDLTKALNDRWRNGVYQGMDEPVKVFRLDGKSEITLVSKKIQKSIPEHVEERKWEETEWSVEAKKP
jgi:hypothetical protein